jgi:hypothetical protein
VSEAFSSSNCLRDSEAFNESLFEVASVKPAEKPVPGRPSTSVRREDGSLDHVNNYPLKTLVTMAYTVKRYRQFLVGVHNSSLHAGLRDLGLKLEPRKAPLPGLVIDSILKSPTEN